MKLSGFYIIVLYIMEVLFTNNMYCLLILFVCLLNTGKHALTKIAKGIVKVCKEDVSVSVINNY